jgi:hypothetical protein
MEKTLHLPDYGYNLAAALFYIFYAAFEVGSLCFLIEPSLEVSRTTLVTLNGPVHLMDADINHWTRPLEATRTVGSQMQRSDRSLSRYHPTVGVNC